MTLIARVGHHSTSDDFTLYRSKEEVKDWEQEDTDPILKFSKWYDLAFEHLDTEALKKDTKKELLHCLKLAESKKKPNIDALFCDVYDNLTPNLELQKKELKRFLIEYPQAIDTSCFSK
ncbi:hypothetical protein DI09_35p110 [Mitosporidium daphniae]|uniref:2-oxoisovalerate dehydrogenase subunit alpha n=1 Tax=Mitosporidium daphniae TaxID=1485682 RepID=A0A098VQW9_9MICR|nr:uncharacterized protein DI09_35p110 [Mitosporidium daphniae]KGG51423.1 hypothetical protein DI09_35p110 [Mitosporidium daphniae]|eukprot:XP_013237850.1 uncharacterized protein DI09_35p110 [Mitosporidium daphniae]